MERIVTRYLSAFSEKVTQLYGDNVPLAQLFSDAEDKKLNIVENYDWLNDFSEAIAAIQRIIGHEHIHVKTVKELTLAETAARVDVEGFRMTLQDSQQWTDEGGELHPKKAYSNFFEDEYAIYENRFIKMLIDQIIRYLSETLIEVGGHLGNLRSYFGAGVTAAGALNAVENANVLADNENPLVAVYEKTEKLLKKVKLFTNSTLYKECAKKPNLTGIIQPTNILTKDPVYCICYKFYKQLLKFRGNTLDLDITLFENTLLKLCYALHRAGYAPTVTKALRRIESGRLTAIALKFTNEQFNVYIDVIGKQELRLRVLEKANQDNQTHVAVKIADLPLEETEAELEKYRKAKKKQGYEEAYLFINSRAVSKAEAGVVNVGASGDLENRATDDFVRGLTLLLSGAHAIFAKVCPVCGKRFVEETKKGFLCNSCQSLWTQMQVDGKEMLWLKRVSK